MTRIQCLWWIAIALCACTLVRVRAVVSADERRYMLELHSKLERGGGRLSVRIGNRSRDLGRVTAVHSLQAAEQSQSPDGLQLRFNLSGLALTENVRAAELRLHPHLAALVTLDVTTLVRRWQRRRDLPSVVLLQRNDTLENKANLVIFTRTRASPQQKQTQNEQLWRQKRNVRNAARRKRKRMCSLQRMHVPFDRLPGFDWIYAPSSYEAGICVGSCNHPLSNLMNASNHAHIQSMVNAVDRDVPPPCCVPTKLAPLRMLYYDQIADQVMLADYSDMIALECGCR